MKTQIKINRFGLIVWATIFFTLSGCSDYFSNPLEDKETGEKINLLVVDFNFFHTRMSYKLIDATSGEIIKSDATVQFSGKNANDIVTYAGEKNEKYQTTEGQLELTIDPNIEVSVNTPVEFSVNAEVEGYNPLSKGISINNEGIKTIELFLSKQAEEEETDLTGGVDITDGDTIFYFIAPAEVLKSANAKIPYTIKHSFSISDLMKFRDMLGAPLFTSSTEAYQAFLNDPENFIRVRLSKFSYYPPEIDVVNFDGIVKNALFQKLETGTISKIAIDSKVVGDLNGGKIVSTCKNTADFLPLLLQFVQFENSHWNMLGDNISNSKLSFYYTLATISEEDLCKTGSKIIFNSNVISSFSFDTKVYNKDNKLITSMTFQGDFPDTFLVENVPAEAVKLVFTNNNPSFNEILPLEIPNFCNGVYNVNVSPTSGYQEYRIVLKALCKDNKEIAFAPTYSAQIKLKDTNVWQGINMTGGVVDVLGVPNADYQLRLLWQNEWEYSSFSTKFDANGNYLGAPEPDTEISSKKLEDGRIQINVETIFEQNICNDLGW